MATERLLTVYSLNQRSEKLRRPSHSSEGCWLQTRRRQIQIPKLYMGNVCNLNVRRGPELSRENQHRFLSFLLVINLDKTAITDNTKCFTGNKDLSYHIFSIIFATQNLS